MVEHTRGEETIESKEKQQEASVIVRFYSHQLAFAVSQSDRHPAIERSFGLLILPAAADTFGTPLMRKAVCPCSCLRIIGR